MNTTLGTAPIVDIGHDSSSTEQLKRKDGNKLDKDAFFKLLTTQLRYQDPLNPMDDTQFISQMAQFSSLEQMQNMNKNLSQFLRIQSLSEGASLIGKTVETIDSQSGKAINGVVTKVFFKDGKMYASLDDGDTVVDIEGITAIADEE